MEGYNMKRAFRNLSLVIGVVFVLFYLLLIQSISFMFPIEVLAGLNALGFVLAFALGYYILFGD